MTFDIEKNEAKRIEQTNNGTKIFIIVRMELHLIMNFTEYVLTRLSMNSSTQAKIYPTVIFPAIFYVITGM